MKMLVALVGTRYRGEEIVALFKSLPQGEPLALIRQADNQIDRNAVQVWARDKHLGFVKSGQVDKIARRMDRDPAFKAGMASGLRAKLAIDGGKQPMVEIEE